MKARLFHFSVIISVICLLLSGCGFHLRSAADFPASLKTLHLISKNVNAAITSELRRQLIASGVSLTSNPNAPYTLSLMNSHINTKLPTVFDSNAASIVIYTITVSSMKLTNQKHKALIDTSIMARQSVVYNVNQVGTAVITPLMRRTLTRQVVNSIFNRLANFTAETKVKQKRL